MPLRIALALVVLAGCRLQFGKWQGAPPRAASDRVKVGLYAGEERVRRAVQQVWGRDPTVELTTIDGPLQRGAEEGCEEARKRGLDYFVAAGMGSSSSAETVCTKHADGSIFDKKDPECIEGYEKNQRSSAAFQVTTYDATDCHAVATLSANLRTDEPGNTPDDRAIAEADVLAMSDLQMPTFPAQTTIDATARITGDEPGFYAVFRNREYIGTMQVDDPHAPGKMLTCCYAVRPGDALVRRGRVTQISFDLSGILTQLRVAGAQQLAGGAGLAIRHYKMDGGLEVTLLGETLSAGASAGGAGTVIGTVGWGFRPSRALRLSAHAGGGLAYLSQSRQGLAAHAVAPVAWFGGRAIFTPVPWLYIGADVGYYASAAVDDWEGEGHALADPMAMRAPIARVFAGFSQ